MLSRFFIDRPVFAWVIAIAMMLAGGLAIYNLPVSQYPPIAPPSVSIRGSYSGASAKTVEDSVVQIIEQKMTGIDRMIYMSSTADSSGGAGITLTFSPGTDPDIAWSKVQNKLQLALPMLPDEVQRRGLTVSKSTRNYLMMVGLTSADPKVKQEDLGDYAVSTVEAILARVPGVGEVEVMGSGYAMRVWLDPDRLTKYGMTASDVTSAIRTYNVETSAGQLGGAPAVPGQRLNASILVQSLLVTPEEFAGIPVRTDPDGSVVRVRDVGRTELGTEMADIRAQYNGRPAAMLAIRQEAGANALDTAAGIKAAMDDLSRYFPPGMKVIYPMDTTPFVRVAIGEVVKTLLEAIVLVFLVMYLFLGNLRATLVPSIAVPVVILGTFGVLGALGYSVNMLTMFGMVLAIGLLVDDAIVVVENVERVMSEEGLPPKEATRKSMDEISSALIGIGLVLAAVFGPMMFFPGSTGVIYRQFSVTVIASMLLSVVVALILSPVLCASLLRPVEKGHEAAETGFRLFRPFFLWFDRVFYRARDGYQAAVAHILRRNLPYAVVFVVIVAGLAVLFSRMPTGYLPDEDQGSLMGIVQLPAGSTIEQTEAVLAQIKQYFVTKEPDAVESFMGVAGVGTAGRGQNQAMAYIRLKDWDARRKRGLAAKEVAGRAMRTLSRIKQASIYVVPPPPVIELGNATGFDFMLQDRGGLGHDDLSLARDQLIQMAAKDPRLVRVRPNGMPDVPQYKVDIDWDRAGALGVPVGSIQSYLATSFGASYVNDFVQGGRIKRVYAQADAPFRMQPEDLGRLYLRNSRGGLVPFSAVASGRWIYGPPRLERYNGVPAMNIQGEPAPGYSSGDAMRAMEELTSKLPAGVAYQWTGLSYQELMAQSQAGLLYAFSVLVIFLVLAALYESWTVPITDPPCTAPRGRGRRPGVDDARPAERRLLPDRLADGARPHDEERHPDRAVRAAPPRRGDGARRGNHRGGQAPPPADRHDVAGVRIRRPAARHRRRGRRGRAEGHWHERPWRHGHRHVPRDLLHPAVLRGRRSAAGPQARGPAGRTGGVQRRAGPGGTLMKRRSLACLLAGLALALGGCSLAPQDTRPASPVPPELPGADVTADAAQVPDVPWREFFTDERLRSIVERALANNRDLRVAALNVERAQALYRVQRADRVPPVSLGANVSSSRTPDRVARDGEASTSTTYAVALGVSGWEVDLFGRVRSLEAAALEQFLATEQAGRATQLALVAAVAQAYLARAADTDSLKLAQSTLEAQQASLALIQKVRDLGVASDLELSQVRSQVEAARADVARFTALVATDLNALQVLVGAPIGPGLLPDGLLAVSAPRPISAGVSSEVLLRRPDILSAEHQLRSANATIGAARAAYFPRISLTTGLGIASSELSSLFGSGTGTWSFAPQIVQPIFNAGSTRAKVRVSMVDREIAVARYEKQIQQAFAEVSNALALRQTLLAQREAQEALVKSLDEIYRLSDARYKAGLDSYLGVLVAQRALFTAQQALVSVRLAEHANLVTLYKVLGGGV